MSMRTSRRSTRSQSRELASRQSSDDEPLSVATTSSRRSLEDAAKQRRPRGTSRKVNKQDTIAEDDVLIVSTILDASPMPSFVKEEEGEEGWKKESELIEELEVAEKTAVSAVSAVDHAGNIVLPSRPKKIRSKVLGLLARLVARGVSHLPPFLIAASMLLAALLPSPNEPFARKVYVDENALQPGSASVDWSWSQVEMADRAAERIASIAHAPAEVRAAFLTRELRASGLSPHNQTYTFEVPSKYGVRFVSGINTYARFPAARGDGREAFVLAASWKSTWDGSDDPDVSKIPEDIPDGEEAMTAYEKRKSKRINVRGLASTLILAKHLSGYAHWSKDLIFVFSDGEMEGMQAWTSAYFGRSQTNLKADQLMCGGSSIWNALAIDYPSDSFSHIVIKHEGLQGQLPNLDVINTLTKIAQSTDGIPVNLPASSEHDELWQKEPMGAIGNILESILWEDENGAKKYLSGLSNLAKQIAYLSAGRPSGIHGVFHRYHVDAITVFLQPAQGPYGFHHIGRAIESMTRSMSNLLERLHHSQFFYLLTSPYKFIEVAKYLPVTALFSAALTITAISIWVEEGRGVQQRQLNMVEAVRAAIAYEQKYEGIVSLDDGFNDYKDVKLEDPTTAHLISSLLSLLVDRSLQQGHPLGPSKMRSVALFMQIFGRPIVTASVAILLCHIIGASAYYILISGPVDCAADGLEHCKPLRLISTVSILGALMIIIWIRRINKQRLAQQERICRSDLPEALLSPLLSSQVYRGRAVTRTLHSFLMLECGMLILATSLVNFSLALIFSALLCIPLCSLRLPLSTTDELEASAPPLRSISPASDDTETVEALTPTRRIASSLRLGTRIRLWLCSALFLGLMPFALIYLAKLSSIIYCEVDQVPCAASTWLDWAFDDTLLQHHILGTLTVSFVTLIYLPIILVAFVASSLAAMS